MNKTHNGRSNRETRLVSLYYNPETKEDLNFIKEQLEELENEIKNPFLKDFVNF